MHQIYELFNIPRDEKNKKKTLSTSIWEPNYDPDVYAQVFHNLFPELEKTFDLAPVLPSKKSLKRMGIANDSGYSSLPSPLTEKAMTRSQVDAIILEDLAHVSNSLFNSLHLVLSGSKTFENSIEDEPMKQRQYDAVSFIVGNHKRKRSLNHFIPSYTITDKLLQFAATRVLLSMGKNDITSFHI